MGQFLDQVLENQEWEAEERSEFEDRHVSNEVDVPVLHVHWNDDLAVASMSYIYLTISSSLLILDSLSDVQMRRCVWSACAMC